MKSAKNRTNELTKDDIRLWTKAIMAKKYPEKTFSEEDFEKGFRTLDKNKDGKINL